MREEDKKADRETFKEINVELLPLRADSSDSLRATHYSNTIQVLVDALEKVFVESEESSSDAFVEKYGF